jgi:hypothetical protein
MWTWEDISESDDKPTTHRMQVPTGWVVMTDLGLVFVPN